MVESFYDVLGVGRDASQSEIEAAYRERVKETHPDLNDSPSASADFQRVQVAEEVLADPSERARYDRLGHGAYTAHFGDVDSDGDSRWDVGADPTPEEAGYDPDDVGDWRRSYSTGGGGSVGEHDFGFDPSEYDSTREYDSARSDDSERERDDTGSGNPSERSYDVGDDGEPAGDSAGKAAGRTGGAASTDGGPGASDPGGVGGRATGAGASVGAGVGPWRAEAERTRRKWSKAAQRAARNDSSDDPGGYAVHDWDEEELAVERTRYPLEGSDVVVIAIMFVLYPFMAYSAVTPAFSLPVNLVVGVCVLALTAYLLTMPRIGFYVFGSWSVLAPLLVAFHPTIALASLVGLAIVGAAWIPFGYSVLFMRVVR